MARIGGEYVDPRDGVASATVPHARWKFYEKIGKLAPRVLRSLYKDVLPMYPGDEEEALQAWAVDYGMTDPWALTDARWTLWTWHEHPQTVRYERLQFLSTTGPGGALHEGPRPPTLTLPTAALTLETWDQYSKRARAALGATLSEYRRAWQRYAKEHGLIGAPEKRGEDRNDVHFELLVRYHVEGWSHKRIAKTYAYASEKSVGRAIRATKDLIVLTGPRAKKKAPVTGATVRGPLGPLILPL